MEALAGRLRMSREEAARLSNWAFSSPVRSDASERAFRQTLYGGESTGISDRLKLALANARHRAEQDDKALVEAGGYARLLKLAENWEKPAFPLKGADLLEQGWQKGPKLGMALKALEKDWIASDFRLERDALLERAAAMLEKRS
jgi:tRNA nucleotidyltransferase/poly(A) polymerase